MAARQGATPPAWLGRSRMRLLADVVFGWKSTVEKLVQLVGFVIALFRPTLVRARLTRLRTLGHIDECPTLPQLLVAARDQMMISASEETRIFYRDQGIPWIFHNSRRFLAGPATMLDPVGLFSTRNAIIYHVLQTFHRHPHYDLVLLRAHEGGVEEIERQAAQIVAGTHPDQRALTSLIEDGGYHARLPADISAFRADPLAPARPVAEGLLSDPFLMLGMDQFKDIRGYTRYAARLNVRTGDAIAAWLKVAWNELLGGVLGKLGPKQVDVNACDAEIVRRWLKAGR